MIVVDIDGVNYQVRTEWADNTVRQFNAAFNHLNIIPEALRDYIYPKEGEERKEPSQKDIIKFYIDWIALFSNIPKDLLSRNIEIVSERDVSLDQLFSLVSKFLYDPRPEEIEPRGEIKHKGISYELVKDAQTASGIKKMLGGATYEHFMEASALVGIFGEVKENKFDKLAHLTAILFKEKGLGAELDDEAVKKRTEAFKELPMDVVFSSYFFLSERMSKLVKSLETSLAQEVKKAVLEARVKKSSQEPTGISKLSTWLKKVFLPNKERHL